MTVKRKFYLWPIFSNYASKCTKVWKNTISMLNNIFTFGFREKIVLPGYRKLYLRNLVMYSYLTLDLYFNVKPMSWCLLRFSKSYNVCNLVYVVIIKHVICMNDRFNTCNIIHARDLTLTFISMTLPLFSKAKLS
jgi:hypothetical protein